MKGNKNKRVRRHEAGFSLVEIVLALILFLMVAAIVIPSYRASVIRTHAIHLRNNMLQIGRIVYNIVEGTGLTYYRHKLGLAYSDKGDIDVYVTSLPLSDNVSISAVCFTSTVKISSMIEGLLDETGLKKYYDDHNNLCIPYLRYISSPLQDPFYNLNETTASVLLTWANSILDDTASETETSWFFVWNPAERSGAGTLGVGELNDYQNIGIIVDNRSEHVDKLYGGVIVLMPSGIAVETNEGKLILIERSYKDTMPAGSGGNDGNMQ